MRPLLAFEVQLHVINECARKNLAKILEQWTEVRICDVYKNLH